MRVLAHLTVVNLKRNIYRARIPLGFCVIFAALSSYFSLSICCLSCSCCLTTLQCLFSVLLPFNALHFHQLLLPSHLHFVVIMEEQYIISTDFESHLFGIFYAKRERKDVQNVIQNLCLYQEIVKRMNRFHKELSGPKTLCLSVSCTNCY